MSGQVFDIGSVVSFTPIDARAATLADGTSVRHIGYAVVVTARDMWVVTTALASVVLAGGDVTPRIVLEAP